MYINVNSLNFIISPYVEYGKHLCFPYFIVSHFNAFGRDTPIFIVQPFNVFGGWTPIFIVSHFKSLVEKHQSLVSLLLYPILFKKESEILLISSIIFFNTIVAFFYFKYNWIPSHAIALFKSITSSGVASTLNATAVPSDVLSFSPELLYAARIYTSPTTNTVRKL